MTQNDFGVVAVVGVRLNRATGRIEHLKDGGRLRPGRIANAVHRRNHPGGELDLVEVLPVERVVPLALKRVLDFLICRLSHNHSLLACAGK